MSLPQAQVLLPVPAVGRWLTFNLRVDVGPDAARAVVRGLEVGPQDVVGVGSSLSPGVAGLRPFPALDGPAGPIPSTQAAVVVFLGGEDAGGVLHRARRVAAALDSAFMLDEDTATFRYAGGRDLGGYEDGTENPDGEKARAVAFGEGSGTFLAIQRWAHDLAHFEGLTATERDHVIGRSIETNDELEEAPPSAHVKRAAQESYSPEAFMVRRSMPWGDATHNGLVFVAFAASLDPFERVLKRMVGLEDGVVDGLFRFTRPVTGGYYWCPPLDRGRPVI